MYFKGKAPYGMDEKKIFLAYVYRALALLYTHLYKVKAFAVFDNMYEYSEEEQCACKDVMPTPLSSLALHYRIAREIEERYHPPKKVGKYLQQCIDLLLNEQTPDRILATCANLYKPSVDRYNPIFNDR